jgi:uncharacterized membrane protein YhaH (DUF805 family)
MVKLATARECRAYNLGAGGGSGTSSRNRWEYINAGVYVFSAVLLVGAFLGQLLATTWGGSSRTALVAAAVGLAGVLAVNVHDLLAHVAGVDYRLGIAAGLDSQLALVEIAVPAVQIAGTALMLVAVVFFEIQVRRRRLHDYMFEFIDQLVFDLLVFMCTDGERLPARLGEARPEPAHRRAGALVPGLRAQHLPGVRACQWPRPAPAEERPDPSPPGEHPLPRRRHRQPPRPPQPSRRLLDTGNDSSPFGTAS